MDVVFHSHFRSSESFTIIFITFSWKATHVEVFQNQQPEAPTRLGDLLRKECLARLPLNSEGRSWDRWPPEPPASTQSGACVRPGEHPTLARPWGGFPSALSPMAATADEEPRPPSPSSRLGVAPSGVWGNGLRRAWSSWRRRETGQGVDFGVCEEETGLSPASACKSVASTLSSGHPTEEPRGLFTHERGLTDSPCLHYDRDGVRLVQTRWGGTSLLNAAFCLFSQMPFTSAHHLNSPLTFYLLQKEVKQVLQQP